MYQFNQGRFRQQARFLRHQFLQDGKSPSYVTAFAQLVGSPNSQYWRTFLGASPDEQRRRLREIGLAHQRDKVGPLAAKIDSVRDPLERALYLDLVNAMQCRFETEFR